MIMAQLQLDDVRLPRDHLPAPGSIEALLPQGAASAISARDLARITGCRDTRELRKRVASERSHGALILSLPSIGYFTPSPGEAGEREARAFIASMRSRALKTLHATDAARDYLEGCDLW